MDTMNGKILKEAITFDDVLLITLQVMYYLKTLT